MTAGEVFAAFGDAWNAGDAAERVRLLDAACVPDAVFISPGGPVQGTTALSDAIGQFRRAFPASVVSFGIPNEHNGFARVAWVTQFGTGQPSWPGTISRTWLPTGASCCWSQSTGPRNVPGRRRPGAGPEA
jgi:hypothetical protein